MPALRARLPLAPLRPLRPLRPLHTTRARLASPPPPPATALPRLKTSTGITGLALHPTPLTALAHTYASTLSLLATLPPHSVYRQSTAALTTAQLTTVQNALARLRGRESDAAFVEQVLEEVERECEWSVVEDGVRQAETELRLVGNMLEWKAWEPLEHPAPPGQWHYFSMAEEAGEGGEDQNVDGAKR